VSVNVIDSVETSLADKGTGVRGVVLVAMLRYLADHTQRSVVFAVEEPEAFLHPGAQENLRDDLEKLAERPDVTLLVTTHSPFIVSRDPAASVIALAKDTSGATWITGQAAGDQPRASLLGGLFKDAALPDLLERATRLPDSARGSLIVEGWDDEQICGSPPISWAWWPCWPRRPIDASRRAISSENHSPRLVFFSPLPAHIEPCCLHALKVMGTFLRGPSWVSGFPGVAREPPATSNRDRSVPSRPKRSVAKNWGQGQRREWTRPSPVKAPTSA